MKHEVVESRLMGHTPAWPRNNLPKQPLSMPTVSKACLAVDAEVLAALPEQPAELRAEEKASANAVAWLLACAFASAMQFGSLETLT